ncbi:hypothetical protein EJ03DRAFT_214247 [Teratosphaeria nubilosa]|uniref:Uncharacterized protein n=1 Tax=Teratosphaeria nubilosa TaxID=161662 RepID=A0A6G1LHV4_9PEZI|nr:hypothetical protein EJ03DRAFT_214247 [Teratosphaeria nubilosa]
MTIANGVVVLRVGEMTEDQTKTRQRFLLSAHPLGRYRKLTSTNNSAPSCRTSTPPSAHDSTSALPRSVERTENPYCCKTITIATREILIATVAAGHLSAARGRGQHAGFAIGWRRPRTPGLPDSSQTTWL